MIVLHREARRIEPPTAAAYAVGVLSVANSAGVSKSAGSHGGGVGNVNVDCALISR